MAGDAFSEAQDFNVIVAVERVASARRAVEDAEGALRIAELRLDRARQLARKRLDELEKDIRDGWGLPPASTP